MSEVQGSRAERMARYKEERRKQLAEQFAPLSEPQVSHRRRPVHKETSSSSEEPRTTRASRLRAAAQDAARHSKIDKEKSHASLSSGGDAQRSNKLERDKSSKRKSNLNRALNSEEVPQLDATDDVLSRRRRRRFFPPEVLQQTAKDPSPNDENSKSDSLTASSSVVSNTTSSIVRTAPKKSELRVHMENARKGQLVSYSEMGKPNRASPKRSKEKSPILSTTPDIEYSHSFSDSSNSAKLGNKENIKLKSPLKQEKSKLPILDNDQPVVKQRRSINVSRRMDELTALTRDTLARVERLANKTTDFPKRDVDLTKKASTSSTKPRSSSAYEAPSIKDSSRIDVKLETKADTRVPLICDSVKTQTHSILKKKSIEEPFVDVVPTVVHNPVVSAPVSILKRKVSQDEFRFQGGTPTSTPPVTFSPSVVDPAINRKKQGILKKRRSLDEAQVLRHRSCSPEVALNGKPDSRSILKNQRRSSLEEIVRTQSPESGLHGILKRRTSRHEDEVDPPINSPEPHGILKRKSGTSSAGSNVNSPHVSIATAVILAAARGAEMILEPNEPFTKPILKKKSFSDDQPSGEGSISEVPKPILKKKSSTDTEDCEERPKKTILKNAKSSLEERECEIMESVHHVSSFKYAYQKIGDDSECDVRPILKTPSRENSPRPRLSFYADEGFSSTTIQTSTGVFRHQKSTRRSHTICTDFNVNNAFTVRAIEDRELEKPRPLSVSDMVLNFEKQLSTGAIPKKTNPKRERYKTQPVTYHELEASLSSVQNPFQQDLPTPIFPLSSPILPSNDTNGHNAHSLLDLTTSFDIDNNNLNSLLSSSLPNTTFDSGISGKMSSDSAFQSLGDGLELEQEETPASPPPPKILPDKIQPAKLQMKALAEEAKNMFKRGGPGGFKLRSRKGVDGAERPNSSRFATQPVTLDEVQEASRFKNDVDADPEVEYKRDKADPSRLSLSDRIKMFSNTKISEEKSTLKPRLTRFQTQPVTLDEVQSARAPPNAKRNIFALESSKNESAFQRERKGILKSQSGVPEVRRISPKFPDSLKSVLKKHDSPKLIENRPRGLRSILKPETTDFARDEGISSDESGSGSEADGGAKTLISVNSGSDKESKADYVPISERLAKIVSEKSRLEKSSDNNKTDSKSSGEDTTQTSDGDSSGGREVRSIIRSDFGSRRRLRDKFNNEGLILKSKSQGVVQDEDEIQACGVQRSMTQATMPKSIAELQAKLQKSGDHEWRKRIPKLNNANEELSLLNVKNIYNEELSEKTSILSARKDELDAAAKQWKSRVEQSDAVNFSVAGRMQQGSDIPTIPINIPAPDKSKRTPKAKAFKGREAGDISSEAISTPTSPEKTISSGFKRSISLPGAGDTESAGSDASLKASSRRVRVERPDNITFTSFFESIDAKKTSEAPIVSVDDFDSVVRQTGDLLVQKRTVRVQRRREASRNPVKALAARADIKDEYTEFITGVAEREKQRLNIEKLAKSSNFAVEALAGLASKEDFSSVALKRSSSWNSSFPPYKDLMLIQIKGRRYVQTRLVEPIASSVNDGDNFILVTPDCVFNYIGSYSNVIEQSRAADIVNSIHQTSDLGSKTERIVTINAKKLASCLSSDVERFWKLLGSPKGTEAVPAGHPDEDEIYESSILGTNMIYEYRNEALVPIDTYWGSMPKIEMLSPFKTTVFDFGSEMYVWSGKSASLDDKKKALKLAREMWTEGYNYTECGVSPLGISTVLGSRSQGSAVLKDSLRPKWALFAKITQHRETVLFKEKFLDWPDYSRVIRVKQDDNDKNNIEAKFDFKPCDIGKMCKKVDSEPDLKIDGVHLGRGATYYDDETNRLFNFSTISVTCWVIMEYSHEKLGNKSVGHFHDGNSYIIRWQYCANITGRELSGKPSKYVQAGRDHCVYFCWQGTDATINEKGAAALLTIELDSENARQIRVLQGAEPPAFLSLFKGGMVVHSGKREKPNTNSFRLYICRGELESETFLTEVPCSMRYLRSRSCFVLVNCKSGDVTIWNGCKATKQSRKITHETVEKIIDNQCDEFGFFDDCDEFSLSTVEEGSEGSEFLSAVGGDKRQLYLTLTKSSLVYDYTPRLFHLSSISGSFEAVEVLGPHRSEHVTPYPFLQSDMYSASQPALFMLDNGHEVWLWQGWWPEREDDLTLVDQTGSGAIRWQEERKVAMQTVVNYCRRDSGAEKIIPSYLVWAGLEPLAFTNLFPFWRDHDDITELNIQEGKKAGEAIIVEKELALLTRSTYPLEQLLQRPLPDGVDPTHLEKYLSPEDFSKLMTMTLEEFHKLPSWKQTSVKKEKGLF